MIGLTDAELTAIRADIEDLLPDTGYIIAVTETADGLGGQSIGTSIAGTVSCRLDPKIINTLNSGEEMVGAAVESFHRWILTLPYNTTIAANNQFLHNDVLYNVSSIDDDKSWKASVRVMLEKV